MKVEKLGKALFLAVRGKNEQEKQKIVKNLVRILEKKKKTYFLFQILKEFVRYSREDEVVLTLSRETDRGFIEKIKQDLRKIFPGKSTFRTVTDENIISGFQAQSNDYLVDASIKEFIKKLKPNF